MIGFTVNNINDHGLGLPPSAFQLNILITKFF
jgi:hypothetical protein